MANIISWQKASKENAAFVHENSSALGINAQYICSSPFQRKLLKGSRSPVYVDALESFGTDKILLSATTYVDLVCCLVKEKFTETQGWYFARPDVIGLCMNNFLMEVRCLPVLFLKHEIASLPEATGDNMSTECANKVREAREPGGKRGAVLHGTRRDMRGVHKG